VGFLTTQKDGFEKNLKKCEPFFNKPTSLIYEDHERGIKMKPDGIKSIVLSAVSSVVCTTTLILEGYDLLLIEDGETPLSKGPQAVNYFPLTCGVIAAIIITILLVLWLVNRDRHAKRLKELNKKLERKTRIPFFIKTIKEEITLAESELGEKIFKNEQKN